MIRHRPAILLCTLLFTVPSPSWADFQRDFGITVVGEAKLSQRNREALRGILSALPRALYEQLECISVGAPPGCDTLGLRGVNIFPDGNTGVGANPWPPDFQGRPVDPWYEVAIHELIHALAALWNDSDEGRGMRDWTLRMVAEAGCTQANYLRSQIPACYFVQNPQEFEASIGNLWFASSKDVLRLGLKRFDAGNAHPLNQAIFYLAFMGTDRWFSWTGWRSDYGTVLAYEYQAGVPKVSLWQVFPWRCPGPIQVTGPDFSLGIETDDACHVTAITHREGV